MKEIKTSSELRDILKSLSGEEELDRSELKYVIYARKSTESSEKQIRSLSDQINECTEYAERNGLRVVETIQESESAKEPDIRPRFKKMMEGIMQGKYQAIIAWHPDRLARNMKEAGNIIDLLDKNIIKDLQFPSFTFENTPNGKMSLGIQFILSKEYSDKLSQNVKRGIRHSIEEGKYLNRAKHGYFKDPNQYLRPDGDNFALVKEAFKMRIDRRKLDEIADQLNKNGYTRLNSKMVREPYKMDKKRVLEVLNDPFYAGVLIYGKEIVDLNEAYDFIPTVTVEEFLKINRLKDITQLSNRKFRLSEVMQKDDVSADLMRGMIICGHCNEKMVAGITKKKTKTTLIKYFYYRCDSPGCLKRGKSIKPRIITKFASELLQGIGLSSRDTYGRYLKEFKILQKKKNAEIDQTIRSANQKIVHKKKKAEQIKLLLLNENDLEIKTTFKGDFLLNQKQITQLENIIFEAKKLQEKNKTAQLSYDKFLELFGNMASRLAKISSLKELDNIMKKFFLNFTIADGNVASFKLKQPFEEMVESEKVRNGARERT